MRVATKTDTSRTNRDAFVFMYLLLWFSFMYGFEDGHHEFITLLRREGSHGSDVVDFMGCEREKILDLGPIGGTMRSKHGQEYNYG